MVGCVLWERQTYSSADRIHHTRSEKKAQPPSGRILYTSITIQAVCYTAPPQLVMNTH